MADYEYNSDDGWSDPDNEADQDDTEIEIENNYYEADCNAFLTLRNQTLKAQRSA